MRSKKDIKLRDDTADILKKMGYNVSTNKTVGGPRGGSKKIDIIAENLDGRVAFEVGKLNKRKFDQLSRSYGFNQVIHVPNRENLQEALNMLGSDLHVKYDEEVGTLEVVEEAGVVTLSPFWDRLPEGVEKPLREKIKQWRLLRDSFGPVTTGVELYISYAVGNGFTVICDCEHFEDNGECEHVEYINNWCETHNLDEHIQEIADRTLTDGFCLVEKVYENSDAFSFESFAIRSTAEDVMAELGEIVRLKIVDAEEHDIDIAREATYDILFYLFDKETETPIQLHPWQISNFSWNKRAPDVLGRSIIEPTEKYVEWLLNIQKSYAKGVFRQGNPIPIFICKNWGKNQLKALRNLIAKREKVGGMGALVFGGEVEAKLLGVEGEMLSRKEAFDHYTEMIASAMTVPSFFFNVSSTTRSEPAEKQMELFQVRVSRFARMMKRIIEKEYFSWLIKSKYGEDAPVPRVLFNVTALYIDEDIKKLRQLLSVRYLSPQLREAAERKIAKILCLKLPEDIEILHPMQELEKGPPVRMREAEETTKEQRDAV